MQNDKTTLKDLSVFTAEIGSGVFGLLQHTTSTVGQDMLKKQVLNPPGSFEALQAVQDTVKFWAKNVDQWPQIISNGTLVMLEKFFESADNSSAPPSGFALMMSNFFQKLLNRGQYFFTQFSISHLSDFLKGCLKFTELLKRDDLPALLRSELEAMQEELQHRLTNDIVQVDQRTRFKDLSRLSFHARREMKNPVYRLIDHYARIDAWRSLALATIKNKWVFPELLPASPVHFEAKGLYHPLLQVPVDYDITFSDQKNFLLLTGANMSGKTTFMRAMGVGALLAHLGTGVPASAMRISFLQGIITNMHVEDNILRGESYFLAEVHRMKHTSERLLQPAPHLVLMDELFKGTNVHDAYECTRAVVEGLLNRPHHLMILSTHLYEVAQHFKETTGIQFAYFVTDLASDGSYEFRYELREGISNDRIGYRILQKEGVLDLLRRSPRQG
ncbi:MutS-related protein [Polluticoccus soli]|uniref:MutS-related protein n=1 Tax=Polluticoccus soli TaxID=3034150 RepID=UPI0023E2B194|nr:DNA mismatch repair protein MutS [Flavipsychrobacter sp. JY13-12]